MAGKHMARKQDDQYAAESNQDQRISNLESQQQQQQQAAPAVAATASSATIDQLKQLRAAPAACVTDAELPRPRPSCSAWTAGHRGRP